MNHIRSFIHDYRSLRWVGLSRRAALWEARPSRIRAIFALIHGNPVMFRMLIEDGAPTFEPGIHGAIVTECEFRVTTPPSPGTFHFEATPFENITLRNNTSVAEPLPGTEVPR